MIQNILVLFLLAGGCQGNIKEPAVLLAAANTDISNTSSLYNFTLACVAYGEPLPYMEWQVRDHDNTISLIREGTENLYVSNTEIMTELEGYSIESIVSVLVACNADMDTTAIIECSASNGLCVDGSVGYQRAQFTARNNFTTQFFLEEIDDCFTTSSQSTAHSTTATNFSMQTTTVQGDFETLIISVSVVACVAIISLAIISSICVLVIGLYKKKKTSQDPSNLTLQYRPYNNLKYELRSKRKTSSAPASASAPNPRVYEKPKQDNVYESVITPPAPAVYSNLRSDWSVEVLAANTSKVTALEVHQPHHTTERSSVPSAETLNMGGVSQNSLVYCNAYELNNV